MTVSGQLPRGRLPTDDSPTGHLPRRTTPPEVIILIIIMIIQGIYPAGESSSGGDVLRGSCPAGETSSGGVVLRGSRPPGETYLRGRHPPEESSPGGVVLRGSRPAGESSCGGVVRWESSPGELSSGGVVLWGSGPRTLNDSTLYFIIIIIAAFIMRTYPSSEDVQGATYYYYPSRWIQFQDRTYSAQFPLPREHSLPSSLSWRYRQINTQHILHILPGTHLYTWVESSNVDKVSCWRTKVPGIDGNRTRNPLIQSQGFTPIHVYMYHGTSTYILFEKFKKNLI